MREQVTIMSVVCLSRERIFLLDRTKSAEQLTQVGAIINSADRGSAQSLGMNLSSVDLRLQENRFAGCDIFRRLISDSSNKFRICALHSCRDCVGVCRTIGCVMAYHIYAANGEEAVGTGDLRTTFVGSPAAGPCLKRPNLLKHQVLVTYQVKLMMSSWAASRYGDNPNISTGFTAYFPGITSCLSVCYYYMKPHIGLVDYMVAHHANCGAVAYLPDDANLNVRNVSMNDVLALIGVPKSSYKPYASEILKVANLIGEDKVHLYLSNSIENFAANWEGKFGE
jgi:hypothetical protein